MAKVEKNLKWHVMYSSVKKLVSPYYISTIVIGFFSQDYSRILNSMYNRQTNHDMVLNIDS